MHNPTLGRVCTLCVIEAHDHGMLLEGGDLGEILLPTRYVTEGLKSGDEIEVFLYTDSEDRIVATTDRPLVMAEEFASLKVVDTNNIGAFLDWGLPKHLLLPFREQRQRVREGQHVLVYVRVDHVSARLVASAKFDKFLAETAPMDVSDGSKVELIIAGQSDLGTNVIVDHNYWGLIHQSVSNVPRRGTRCSGYVARIRDNGLADITLQPPGYKRVSGATEQLTEALAQANDGFLPIHDKSPPEEIMACLGMSKKIFKQALGTLYRERRVRITAKGIQLLDSDSNR